MFFIITHCDCCHSSWLSDSYHMTFCSPSSFQQILNYEKVKRKLISHKSTDKCHILQYSFFFFYYFVVLSLRVVIWEILHILEVSGWIFHSPFLQQWPRSGNFPPNKGYGSSTVRLTTQVTKDYNKPSLSYHDWYVMTVHKLYTNCTFFYHVNTLNTGSFCLCCSIDRETFWL